MEEMIDTKQDEATRDSDVFASLVTSFYLHQILDSWPW